MRNDVLTEAQRRLCMTRNQGRDTKPEVALRKACWSLGYRYRLQARLPGRPDFVFSRQRVAVFVDGCFWHGCPTHYQAPATRAEFWKLKLARNQQRDAMVTQQLTAAGWRVIRIWEHTVSQTIDEAVREVVNCLGKSLSD